MRYVVVGAGAVGGTVAARLTRAGREVVLVGRPGAHLDALRSVGLTLGAPDGTFTVRPPVAAGPDEVALALGDALLIAVKSQDTAAVLEAWNGQPVAGLPKGSPAGQAAPAGTVAHGGPAAHGGTAAHGETVAHGGPAVAAACVPVFCFQNGVDNERQAARRFAEVYGAGVQLPAELTGPGTIAATASPVSGIIELGRFPAGTGTAATRLAEDLSGAGFVATVTDQIMVAKYTKLLRNLRNAVVACCGPLSNDAARELAELATAEGEACLKAAGIAFGDLKAADGAREATLTDLPVNGRARGGSSTWQSLNRGSGSTEADFLNGEIVLLGRLHGAATPVNELLRRTVNGLASWREPPGAVDPADLLRIAVAG